MHLNICFNFKESNYYDIQRFEKLIHIIVKNNIYLDTFYLDCFNLDNNPMVISFFLLYNLYL